MSARPTDWSPLGLHADPVRGDVDSIRASAKQLQHVASMITDQATKLKNLSTTEGWDSDSGKKFHSASGDLATAIAKAKDRYDGVGKALANYADDLVPVQATADAVLQDAITAEGKQREATSRVLPGQPGDPDHETAAKQQKTDHDAASAALLKARRDIQTLTEVGGSWYSINAKAASAINDSSDDSMKDSGWDHFTSWVHSIKSTLDVIKDVLTTIGEVLAVIIIAVLIIFPGTSVVGLLLAAAIVAALSLAVTAAQYSAGDATATDLGFAIAGFVLSAAGVGMAVAAPLEGITAALTKSISFSAARAAGDAGFSASAAYQGIKSIAEAPTVGVRALDALFRGGAADLKFVSEVSTSLRAPAIVASGKVWGIVSTGLTTAGTASFVHDVASGEGVVSLAGDIGDGLSQLHIGAW